MPKREKTKDETPEKIEVSVKNKKKEIVAQKKESPFLVAPVGSDLWRAFDDIFESFRKDFEDLLFPAPLASTYWIPQTRAPLIDLEDHDQDFVLNAEMPGFKKEDIEIEVQEDSVEITGRVGWKYDKKAKGYVCKERACESFYRIVQLPEEIKTEGVTANLADGVLHIVLPKKAPKEKRKITLK